MTRLFFIAGGLYDFAWVAILLLIPERILRTMPPTLAPQIIAIALVGVACLVCAARVRRWLVALIIFAKFGGPISFVAAVQLGYMAWDQWWLPLVNDIIWLPPLIAIWRRGESSPH